MIRLLGISVILIATKCDLFGINRMLGTTPIPHHDLQFEKRWLFQGYIEQTYIIFKMYYKWNLRIIL